MVLAGLLVACMALLPSRDAAASVGATDWYKNFGVVGNVARFSDVAVDSTRNVYVAGSFFGTTLDFAGTTLTNAGLAQGFVAKFDAAGALQWVRQFGGTTANVTAIGVAVDGAGNVNVLGYYSGGALTDPALALTGSTDLFVIQYDSSGATNWAQHFSGAGATAQGVDIRVDATNNIYIAAKLTGAALTSPAASLQGSTWAGVVIKLDSTGTPGWVQSYGGTGATVNIAGLAIDAASNVHVVGSFSGASLTTPAITKVGTLDGFVFKLDATGGTVWTRSYGNAGNSLVFNKVALDSNGNLDIAGSIPGGSSNPALGITSIGGNYRGLALQIAADGTFNWVKTFDGGYSYGLDIAVDSADNLFVTGSFTLASMTSPPMTRIGSTDLYVIKLTAAGNLGWAKNYGSTGAILASPAAAIAVDSAGGVTVATSMDNSIVDPPLTKIGSNDALLIKLGDGYALTAATVGTGSGTVTSSVGGINCGGTCTGTYLLNTAVTLTATPTGGASFAGWTGACTGAAAAVAVTVNADLTCTATFAAAGGGGGTPVPPAEPPPSFVVGGGQVSEVTPGQGIATTTTGSGGTTTSGGSLTQAGQGSVSLNTVFSPAVPLTLTAAPVSGDPMPSWLSFDPVARQFNFTLPEAVNGLEPDGRATARDQSRGTVLAPKRLAARLTIQVTAIDSAGRTGRVNQTFVFYSRRLAGALVAASVDERGRPGTGISGAPALSHDGQILDFQTTATNTVADTSAAYPDIVRYGLQAGVLDRQSMSSVFGKAYGAAYGASHDPAVSGNGAVTAFASDAPDVGDVRGNGQRQIYLNIGTAPCVSGSADPSILISTNAAGVQGNGPSARPALDREGRFVAFESRATNLAAGATSGAVQVLRKDRLTGTVVLVSAGGNADSSRASISHDGRYVAFLAAAGIHVRDVDTGALRFVAAGTEPRLSGSGRYVAYVQGNQIRIADLADGTDRALTAGNGASASPSLSADGRYVVFKSEATNLLAIATTGQQVFVRDQFTGATALVSARPDGAAAGGRSYDPAIAGDGRSIAFGSQATDLVANTPFGSSLLYLTANPLTDPVQSGWWTSGDGRSFGLDLQGAVLVLNQLSFDAAGAPTWIQGSCNIVGANCAGALLAYSNGPTATGGTQSATPRPAGSFALAFASATQAALTTPAGVVPLTRWPLAGTAVGTATAGGPATGLWEIVDNPRGGAGWFIEHQADGAGAVSMLAAPLGYTAAGAPTWAAGFATPHAGSTMTFDGQLMTFALQGTGRDAGGAGATAQVTGMSAVGLVFTSGIDAVVTLGDGTRVAIRRHLR